jgi:hypothetical protein
MLNAIAKLEALGAELGYPHTSQVQGSTVRELRPRRSLGLARVLPARRGRAGHQRHRARGAEQRTWVPSRRRARGASAGQLGERRP